MLFRVFRASDVTLDTARGGPLYVPRDRQGAGRHDSPGRYGAFYAARSPEAAVAEAIQAFRGRDLTDEDLALADGSVLTLAALDDSALGPVLDLDEPAVLVAQGWRPSAVASRDRTTTQAIAVRVFDDGASGLSWWSTLDAAWTNLTLFAERTIDVGRIATAGPVEALSVSHPAVIAAAEHLAIPRTAGRRRSR